MLIQKTVTILRKQCPNKASRSSLSRKLYNWFQLVSFTMAFTFALRRLRRRRRRKIEGGGRDRGGRDRKAEQKEDTELCTSQSFVDCCTMYTMFLLLNINVLLGRGLCTFSNITKTGHQFFFIISMTGGQGFCSGLMMNIASPLPSICNERSLNCNSGPSCSKGG